MKLDFTLIVISLNMAQFCQACFGGNGGYEPLQSFNTSSNYGLNMFDLKVSKLPRDALENYYLEMVSRRSIYGKCFVESFKIEFEHINGVYKNRYIDMDISWKPMVNTNINI